MHALLNYCIKGSLAEAHFAYAVLKVTNLYYRCRYLMSDRLCQDLQPPLFERVRGRFFFHKFALPMPPLKLLRCIICFLLSAACILPAAAQKKIVLNGTLVMKTGETFPYKLEITDSGNAIKGYSLTYQPPDETKTTIHGKLDRSLRTLSFKEKDIVYSHSVPTKAFMCLVNATLDYVYEGGKYVLKGPVTSREADNTACTQGEIVFTNEQEIQNLFAYHEQFDTVITMKKRVVAPVDATTAPVVQEPLVTDKVTTGVEKAYDWHSDTLVIDVWDGGTVDGDRITLQFNGETYLTNYFLQKEKKQLRIPISGYEVNTIAILADNEGSDPPNTASILLTDGTSKYSILAYNKKDDVALIRIRKTKQ